MLEATIRAPDLNGLRQLERVLLITAGNFHHTYQVLFPSAALIFGDNWDYLAKLTHSFPDNDLIPVSTVETISFLSYEDWFPLPQVIDASRFHFEGIDCVALLPAGPLRLEEATRLGHTVSSTGDIILVDYEGQLFKIFNIHECPIVDPKSSRTH